MTNAPGYFCTKDCASADVVKVLSCSVYFPLALDGSTGGATAGAGLAIAIGFGAAGAFKATTGGFGASVGASAGVGFAAGTFGRTLGTDESGCALEPFSLGAPASVLGKVSCGSGAATPGGGWWARSSAARGSASTGASA